jgi:hypothetical protein
MRKPMKTYSTPATPLTCGLNRRGFLAGCAACAATTLFGLPPVCAAAVEKRVRVRVLYSLHGEQQTGADWPNKGFDFAPVMSRIQTTLAARCPDIEFIASPATGEEQAKKIVEADRPSRIDGYLVYQMNCWNRVVQTAAATGKPVLYADFQFGGSGGFLVYTAGFLRSKATNVGFVASSRMEDLVEAAQCFSTLKAGGSTASFSDLVARTRLAGTAKPGRLACKEDGLKTLPVKDCVQRMRESKILAVRGQESGPAESVLEIPVVHVPFAEVNEAWQKADRDQVQDVANGWQKSAASVTGVTRETLEQSAAMYLAMKSVLKKHGANAITMNCLGGFYGGHIHAYPCLGFHQLLNEGLVGACECDVPSTATMVAMTALTHGRPGYISDPVVDTSKRQIIYAHCVASNRAFGPDGSANPFHIMTHSEDRQGASVRSILPVGYMTTTLEVSQARKEILMHRAKAISNDPDDRACRTKLAAEPLGDLEKLFGAWDQWGWHRVTYYGDLKEPVYALAETLGWKVVEEA